MTLMESVYIGVIYICELMKAFVFLYMTKYFLPQEGAFENGISNKKKYSEGYEIL